MQMTKCFPAIGLEVTEGLESGFQCVICLEIYRSYVTLCRLEVALNELLMWEIFNNLGRFKDMLAVFIIFVFLELSLYARMLVKSK